MECFFTTQSITDGRNGVASLCNIIIGYAVVEIFS